MHRIRHCAVTFGFLFQIEFLFYSKTFLHKSPCVQSDELLYERFGSSKEQQPGEMGCRQVPSGTSNPLFFCLTLCLPGPDGLKVTTYILEIYVILWTLIRKSLRNIHCTNGLMKTLIFIKLFSINCKQQE